MVLFRKLRNLQRAFEQGMANIEAATMAMTGATEPTWLLDKPLRGPAGQYVFGQHLGSQQRAALCAPVTLAADRDGQLRAELDARDAARAPYLAPQRQPLRITRIATSHRHQADQVSEHLAQSGLAARPDLVYGLYRVPDHIDSGSMKAGRLVEWDIVHREAGTLSPAPPPDSVWFDAAETWVARRIGEPMVYDEELALAYLTAAGLGPEHTIGIARSLEIYDAATGTADTSVITASHVSGVHVWHRPGRGSDAYARLRSARPVTITSSPAVQVLVLNWSCIRHAVAPSTGAPPLAPSPFPYLPSTAQELLRAYLEIVGINPADCYAAAVTEDVPRDLDTFSSKGVMTVRTNRGEVQPCVDGTNRPRLTGGSRVVIAYRDHPDYAAGRERFAAYEREVLRSQLVIGAERRPLENKDPLDRLPSGLRGMVKATVSVADFVTVESKPVFDKLPPYRYCWPPA